MVVIIQDESFHDVQSHQQHNNNFNTADNNDGDNDKKRPIDKLEDNVKGVEYKGGKSVTNELTSSDTVFFLCRFKRRLTDNCLFERGFEGHGCNRLQLC